MRTRYSLVTALLALALLAVPNLAAATGEETLLAQAATGLPPAGDTATPPVAPDPVIIVERVATSPERVTVGSTFRLTLTLRNATSRVARNTYVALGQSSGTTSAGSTTPGMVVVGTGNVRFVGTLAANRETSVTFDVATDPSGGAGIYSIPVTVSYEFNNVRAEFAQTIGLVLNRDATFSVISAELPRSVMAGEPFDVAIEAANQSRFAVAGVAFSLEASGADVTDGTVQVGSIDAGTTEFIDAKVTAHSPGELEVTFIVRYRDDLDTPKEFRQTYTVIVEEMPDTGEPGGESPEGPEDVERGFLERLLLALFGLGG